ILKAVEAGFNVLADKPMAIDHQAFLALEQAFSLAEENGVLLYDIMTERYEINTILQREFSQIPSFFGELITGSVEEPAITKESVHHFFKEVSGKPLVRPGWFFDVQQQGEGIVDVTTHLVDLVQWECFPDQIIDYRKDIELISARRWPTKLTREQFERGTDLSEVPEYLQKDLGQDGNLDIFSNGEIDYTIKGKHAKVSVIWDFEAPEGTGDTHYSIMRGDKAHLIIRQGAEENYKPVLYAVPAGGQDDDAFQAALQEAIDQLASRYAGLAFSENANGEYEIHVDQSLSTTHEEHFAEVTRKYLGFLKAGEIPEWEVPNMIAKYYTTTQALEMARQ
ncbi:MAG: putative oxidoreductase C-terminal domain-containing protein, partial [Sphingobacterium sp.]